MPNIVAIQELVNGPRNLVLKVDIEGDGQSVEIDQSLVEVGNYNCGEVRLDKLQGQCESFFVDLIWDGTTEAPLFTIIDSQTDFDYDWSKFGGLINPKVANYTGDVLLRTRGFGTAEGLKGSMTLHFVKKRIP